jgi:hypothetical protein
MPQFDSLVIVDLMGNVGNRQATDSTLNGLIEGYLSSYPSEERGQLKADIHTASQINAPNLDDISMLCDSTDDTERRAFVASALERIFETMKTEDNAKKPVLRRIFGGTDFNYETQPQTDRVQRSRANIAKAALAVFTTKST